MSTPLSAPDVFPRYLRTEAERPIRGHEGQGYGSTATGDARSDSTDAVESQKPGLEAALGVRRRDRRRGRSLAPPLPETAGPSLRGALPPRAREALPAG